MKRTLTLFIYTVLILSAASCEKFFDRVPEDSFASSSFFRSEADLVLYANGLINSGMPGASSIARGDDIYTDLCASQKSTEF